MNANRVSLLSRLALAMACVVAMPHPALAQQTRNYDEMYLAYLTAARMPPPAPSKAWMTDLFGDGNARRVNDLVTVRVLESLSATGTADSTVGKSGKAEVGLPGPIGKALSKVLPVSSKTDFAGSGATSRTTELSATLTVRVLEVLSNGDLVIEGVREIDVNGDRQIVVLTGVVRQMDILPGNIAPSSRIGQLRIRCFSQGLIKDSLSPGWLIRVLNKIF